MKFRTAMLISIGMIFLLNGCAPSFDPDPATIKYANDHNLSNKDYQEAEIMCVSDKLLRKQDRRNIMQHVFTMFAIFEQKECERSYKMMTSSHPEDNWRVVYNNCIHNIPKSLTLAQQNASVDSKGSLKINLKMYNGIFKIEDDEGDLYGYVVFAKENGKEIVYAADATAHSIKISGNRRFIKEGILNALEKKPNSCKVFK